LYYYKIENNEKEKKVVFILCKYSFGKNQGEAEVRRHEEIVDNPIYFVTFAE